MEQLLSFVNIADYMLHCTQINSFELGNSACKRFNGNHFLLLRQSCAEHMKSEKCQSCMFFTPKIYVLSHILASETSRPLATYVACARPRDFVARRLRSSLEISKSRFKKRLTCGKSNDVLQHLWFVGQSKCQLLRRLVKVCFLI